MKYKHFTIEEREKTQEMLWQKASIRTIAAALGRGIQVFSSGTGNQDRLLMPQESALTLRKASQQ